MRGKSDYGFAPEGKNIVAIRFRGDSLDAAVMPRSKRGQMREQIIAHVFLVVGGRLDVHKRARQCEQIHFCRAFLDERNERKEPRGYKSRLLPLDSASSE